jgi:hypothetical protein
MRPRRCSLEKNSRNFREIRILAARDELARFGAHSLSGCAKRMNFLPLQFFPEKIAPRGQTFRSLPDSRRASHPLRRRDDDESGMVGAAP